MGIPGASDEIENQFFPSFLPVVDRLGVCAAPSIASSLD